MNPEGIMGERRSVVARLHLVLTILFAGALLTLGVLVAAEKVEIRPVGPAHDSRPPGGAQPPPAGPRIQPVAGAEEFFDLLGHKAYCLKYDGAWIDCWIE